MIVNSVLNPAITIQDDTYHYPPIYLWATLFNTLPNKGNIMNALKSVGRVKSKDGKGYDGTGWFITPDTVVTNAHIAKYFWTSASSKTRIDLKGEYNRTAKRELPVTECLFVESNKNPDIAFIKIQSSDHSVQPIKLAQDNYDYKKGMVVAVIGYPNKEAIAEAILHAVFSKDSYEKKHLQPGQIHATQETTFTHDCSTTTGNSGSVVLDVVTGEAIGLHFGSIGKFNIALKASEIRRLALEKLGLML